MKAKFSRKLVILIDEVLFYLSVTRTLTIIEKQSTTSSQGNERKPKTFSSDLSIDIKCWNRHTITLEIFSKNTQR